MRLLFFLLLGLAGVIWGQGTIGMLSPAGTQQVGVAQFAAFDVNVRSSGTLPVYAAVKFSSTVDLVAGVHSIVLQFVSYRGWFLPGVFSAGWAPFIGGLNIFNANGTVVVALDAATGQGDNYPDVMFMEAMNWNPLSFVPLSTVVADAPLGRPITSASGEVMVVNLQGLTTASRLKAFVQYTMFIPQRLLTPNVPCPQQTLTMMIGYIRTALITNPLPLTALQFEFVSAMIEVATPLTYTCPWIAVSSLVFISGTPSTTVSGAALNTYVAVFILGVPVVAGGYIAFESSQPMWAQNPTTTVWPYVVVGYDCDGRFGRRLCCWQSVVTTRVQLLGSVDPFFAGYQGWNVLRILLGPKGCMLPHDKVITLTITSVFLGKNPTVQTPTINLLDIIAGRVGQNGFSLGNVIVVNVRFFTSSEPTAANMQRLGQPYGPLSVVLDVDIGFGSIANLAVGGFGQNFWFWRGIAWSTYVIGFSVVTNLVVSVSTCVTGIAPEVTISFVITTNGIVNKSFATLNGFLISFNIGVVRPNIGSVLQPRALREGTLPPACINARVFSNPYGTLGLLMNPLWAVGAITDSAAACNAALVVNALVRAVFPQDFFYPNLATGETIYVDLRAIDPFMDASLALWRYYLSGYTAGLFTSADTATLMMVAAWTTCAACGNGVAFGYNPGLLGDICSLSVSDRCVLVNGIASISPVSLGLLQCPNAAVAVNANSMVTFIKVPEAAVHGLNWPWSWISGIEFPVLVSIPGTVVIRILNFGWIVNSPMFAVVVSYPATAASLKALGLTPSVSSSWTLLLIVRIDRMTESCAILNTNPWGFYVDTNKYIVQCLFFPACGGNLVGVALDYVSWGSKQFYAPSDGAVVCWSTVTVSPNPNDDGSDNALFGLLALIAAPILLCYCLLLLLWFLRPKREPPCCVPECPTQEMYWVQAQPPAPVYVVESVACSAQCAPCAPSATPMYFVQ